MPGPQCLFVASRLSTPEKASVVELSPWLSAETLRGWRRPGAGVTEVEGFFRVSIAEWYAAIRRMVRSGLLVPIGANDGHPSLRAGAFAVQKDVRRDRLIADRRPTNTIEGIAGPVTLPYAPRLRRMILKKNQIFCIGKLDLSNAFLPVWCGCRSTY